MVDDKEDAKNKRGLRLLARNRVNCKKPVTIWDCSPLYEPLHFALFYPQGTCGWHAEIGLTPQQTGVTGSTRGQGWRSMPNSAGVADCSRNGWWTRT